MSELKPCPFCGSTNVQVSPYDGGKTVLCMNCLCQTPMYRDDDALEKAVAAWNRRYQEQNEPLTLDQLREMDGKPVWIVNNKNGLWVQFAYQEEYNRIAFWEFGDETEITLDVKDYGKTWLAYRRKPESEEA